MQDATLADLQILMTAKGMKKSEQLSAVEAYQAAHPEALKSVPAPLPAGDSFPLIVPLSSFMAIDQRSAASISSSMRNLTTDLTFSVGNLKWTGAK